MDEKTYILKEKSTKSILIYIAISLVIIPIIYMSFSKSLDDTTLFQVILNLFCYLSLSIIFIIIFRKYLFSDLKDFKNIILKGILIIIGGIILIKCSEALCSWFYKLINQEMEGNNQNSVEEFVSKYPVLMFSSICIFAPFVEEIVFRKCIFSYFNKDIYGILVSTLAFGLIHVISSLDFIHILPYLFAGALFSLAYSLSKRNIWVTIAIHSIVNLISFIILVI